MKKNTSTVLLLVLFILTISNNNCLSQINLVPNPSFEDTLGSCPAYPSQISKAKHWFRQDGGTPDYFNKCAPSISNISIPTNLLGVQNTIDTSCTGYVGIIPYTSFAVIRECITSQLTNQLNIGMKYFVSLKVSLADEVTLANNKLGALFTTSLFNDTNAFYPINNFAHVFSDSIIINKDDWTQINGSFIADSAYNYIIIGNFFNQNNIDTMHLTSSIPSATSYYYIDDVCVSTDSIFCNNYSYSCTFTSIDNSVNNHPKIYPHPFTNILNISFNNIGEKQITILNLLGNPILQEKRIEKDHILNTEDLKSGVYILRIFDNKTLNEVNHIILKTN